MITPGDLVQAICNRLRLVFPGDAALYESLTPVNFLRPSNLVDCEGVTARQIGGDGVEFTFSIKITSFAKVDERHQTHLPLLYARMMTIFGIFMSGYLTVGDRAPKCAGVTGDVGWDFAEVCVSVQVILSRSEFLPTETLPLLERLTIKLEEALEK
ncbi:MAG: hypothetical protein RR426_06295, partial [Oscillospiraceae bacterium]